MSNVREPKDHIDTDAIIATVLRMTPEARQRVEDTLNAETKEVLLQQEVKNHISAAQCAISRLEGSIERGAVITQDNAKSLETLMAMEERIIDARYENE